MDKKFWADEIRRLYFEGCSLDEATRKVRKMMKKQKREELANANKRVG